MTKFIHESLTSLDRHARQLTRTILKRYGKPSSIIYIQRGGMVIGRLLSDHLLVHRMHCANTTFYGGVGKHRRKVKILHLPKLTKTDTYTLLVDDIADTGRTLKAVAKELRKGSREKLVVATVAYKRQSVYKPDVYAFRVPNDSWVVFGYEKKETKHRK